MQSLISSYAATLSLIEVSLGAFLHAFHIPFSGHALSLNQGLILTQACHQTLSRREAISVVNGISIITSVLKSLSPIGKRLTPMLAISVQGLLFSVGILFFGSNLFGILLGIGLLSLWAFAQPLLLAYLFFGEKLFSAVEKLWLDIAEKLNIPVEYGLSFLFSLVALKLLLAFSVGFLAWKYPHMVAEKYLQKILQYQNKLPLQQKTKSVSASFGAFKDLFNPWMVLSMILTIGFMWMTEKSDYFQIFIYTLRVFAIAWLVFFILRAFPQHWIEKLLIRYPTLKATVDRLRTDRAPESTEPKH